MSESEFTLTEEDINLNIWISTGASVASFILCSTVLIAAGWIWRKPHLRVYIDRLSFRLLLWSMVFEVAYDLVYIAVEVYSFEYHPSQFGLCAAGVYFMMAFLGVVNYLCTAIAVNLMLTICFHLNPIKQGLEKWYIGISIFVGMFVPIVPAALGHFGYDPVLEVCWITGRTDEQRMRYFILDLYLWQTLSCIIATASVIATLVALLRQRRATRAALHSGNALNRLLFTRSVPDLAHDSTGTPPTAQPGEKAGRVVTRQFLWTRITGGTGGAAPPRLAHTLSQLEDRFLRIALKISSYPIALIVVNGVITVGDLYISKEGGVHSKAVYGLYCVYYFLYGGRGIVFAFLAFFVDPCLRLGLRAAWKRRKYPNRSLSGIDLESTMLDTEEKSFAEMLAMQSPFTEDVLELPGGRRSGRAGTGTGSKDTDGPTGGEDEDWEEEEGSESKATLTPKGGVGLSKVGSRSEPSLGGGGRRRSETSLDMPAALSHLAFDHEQNGPPAVPQLHSPTPRLTIALPSPVRLHHAFSSRPSRHDTPSPTSSGPGHMAGVRSTFTPSPGPSRDRSSPSPGPKPTFTRSFPGVGKECLPVEMTDEVDVDRRRPSIPMGYRQDKSSPPPSKAREKPVGSDARGDIEEDGGVCLHASSMQDIPPIRARLASVDQQIPGLRSRQHSLPFEPLAPDLPDAQEGALRERRAWREQKRLEKEEAIRVFLETKAML